MVRVLGGGPAGSSAAISAVLEGAEVEIIERTRFPRHRVCGEFLSPEIAAVLDRLGVLPTFLESGPFRVSRMGVFLGSREKTTRFHESAYGLSRYVFDNLLWERALAIGVRPVDSGVATVVATGRPATVGTRSNRLFGFKAHYTGPVDDAIGLYFFDRSYVGVNCVEGGLTNVCGIAPEDDLTRVDFQPEALFGSSQPLLRRLAPLSIAMKWMFSGPLEFNQRWESNDTFYAGDALSFVDPFTGSGLLSATLSGSLAGFFAAQGAPVDRYLLAARVQLQEPFLYASVLRKLSQSAWGERLLPFVPGNLLYRLTRPK